MGQNGVNGFRTLFDQVERMTDKKQDYEIRCVYRFDEMQKNES